MLNKILFYSKSLLYESVLFIYFCLIFKFIKNIYSFEINDDLAEKTVQRVYIFFL